MMETGSACLADPDECDCEEHSGVTLFQNNESTVKTADLLLSIRRLRNLELGEILGNVDETSWNILMDIYLSDSLHRPVVTADLSMIYGIPKTTITRYVEYLCELDLVSKERDPANRVRVLLSLTDSGRARVDGTLRRIASEIARCAGN